jgi:hypothetical protein
VSRRAARAAERGDELWPSNSNAHPPLLVYAGFIDTDMGNALCGGAKTSPQQVAS